MQLKGILENRPRCDDTHAHINYRQHIYFAKANKHLNVQNWQIDKQTINDKHQHSKKTDMSRVTVTWYINVLLSDALSCMRYCCMKYCFEWQSCR